MTYVALSYWDLLLASCLVVINGALSLIFRLNIERVLLIATVRMCLQLGAIGFILKFIFAQTDVLWTVGLALIMISVAGYEIMASQSNPIKNWRTYVLGSSILLFVGTIATIFGVAFLIRAEPWYSPRYILPILGMILGNTLTGISLSLDTFVTSVKRDRKAIEARIAGGARRYEALNPSLRQALKTGMMPIINAMAASGLVTLPGMMTGQILSGVDPVQAAKYQLLIMFLIAGATALGILLSAISAVYMLTDERHRLKLNRIIPTH